jgi:hypothetical protein
MFDPQEAILLIFPPVVSSNLVHRQLWLLLVVHFDLNLDLYLLVVLRSF